MAIVKIVPGALAHIGPILDQLRDEEKEYLEQNVGTYNIAVQEFYLSSFVCTGLIDEIPVCMWGVKRSTVLNDAATVWLLPTRRIDEHKFLFIRHSLLVLEELLREFASINGLTLATNCRSLRWLKWLGCKIEPTENPRIHYFERHRNGD